MTRFDHVQRLRGASPEAVPTAARGPHAAALFALEANRGGARVVTFRVLADGSEYIVTCDVAPVDGRPNESHLVRPYAFASPSEANAFVEEATTALEYLGCEITEPKR